MLGGFRSRMFGIGPQFGYLFPVGDMQGYLNLKAHAEFAAENRRRLEYLGDIFNLANGAHQHGDADATRRGRNNHAREAHPELSANVLTSFRPEKNRRRN
jgi:hypothetical protein